MKRAGQVVALVVAATSAVLLVWPQILGIQRAPGVAQLIAFRAPLGIVFAALALILGVVALSRRPSRQVVATGLAFVFVVAAAGDGAVLLLRGTSDVDHVDAFEPLPAGELTIASWNTQGGATPPTEVARLVLEVRADIVSLPETDAAAAAEIARILGRAGHMMTPETTGDTIPTSVLIADELGDYQWDRSAGSTPGLPSGVWRPTDPRSTGPTIVAAHPMPPLPNSMEIWEAGLRWIARQCTTLGHDVVVAGDLNATIDHLSGFGQDGGIIGACHDAALDTGSAASGTWPSTQPTWLAAPIDHVLAGPAWVATAFRVVETPGGSDHRPIVAVLDRR